MHTFDSIGVSRNAQRLSLLSSLHLSNEVKVQELFVITIVCLVFKTGLLCVALAVLKLTLMRRLASKIRELPASAS